MVITNRDEQGNTYFKPKLITNNNNIERVNNIIYLL
jgi:hypothetical protein